jgi:hypothetical protein
VVCHCDGGERISDENLNVIVKWFSVTSHIYCTFEQLMQLVSKDRWFHAGNWQNMDGEKRRSQ